ncbi:MAG TPA: hypothetical protein VIK86_02030 [Candidatus Paceibacterota bacterium]
MIFYRSQSESYNIDENSISFNCNFNTLEEAMTEDITEFYNELELEEFKQLLKIKNLKEIWEQCKKENKTQGWVEPAICCFSKPQNLIEYYYDYFTDDFDFSNEYILIFEGEFIDYGSEGEDCAIFIKEIERMSVEEFMNKYERR